jgi:hypothetical protein
MFRQLLGGRQLLGVRRPGAALARSGPAPAIVAKHSSNSGCDSVRMAKAPPAGALQGEAIY